MNTQTPIVEISDIDRAVLTAAVAARDFAASDNARRLTPAQRLTALTIAAVDAASEEGLDTSEVSAKLRDIADAIGPRW